MCGLFGFVDQSRPAFERLEKARKALDVLEHRGPDQWGEYVEDGIYMGHRRLSILDLSDHGRQPMMDRGRDLSVSVNGEIYNYVTIKNDLHDAAFVSRSDSEVVLHGYRKWGMRALLSRLEGMYAFVVSDKAAGQLFLARDRVGIKPMYYAHVGSIFAWASELEPLRVFLEDCQLELDNSALYDFLAYRYVPCPKSLFKAIRKLAPASFLSLDLRTGAFTVERYWSLNAVTVPSTRDQAAEELRARIAGSVRSQLVSDVALGCFLSGGMDSSIVAAESSAARSGLQTFSIGFDDPSYDETHYAAAAARAYDTVHRTKTLTKMDGAGLLDFMKNLFGEPFGDYSALPTWHVSRFARSGVVVALSGDGGDEVFGGYPWYERIPRILKWRGGARGIIERLQPLPYRRRPSHKLHSLMNRAALYLGSPLFELYVICMNGVPWSTRQQYRHRLGIPADYDDYWHLRAHYQPSLGPRKSLQYLDFHTYLPDDILTKVDRASMSVSLECRVPLLSTGLVEFGFSLSEEFLYLNGELKGGLKYAYRDVLPKDILMRKKKGFGIPVKRWGLLAGAESFELLVLDRFVESLRSGHQLTT
jgi:asparagine synthase (glutamine-hydrolysing)